MRRTYGLFTLLLLAFVSEAAFAGELHVAVNGNDHNSGTKASPLHSISAAALIAQPGDTVTVHAGTYRERVTPPRGGVSNDKRITYQAAPGEYVEIKGSEVVRTWTQVNNDVWKVTLPNTFFGSSNPYQEVLSGDWFQSPGKNLHTGEVYLNGKSLYEAQTMDAVLKPEPLTQDPTGSLYRWWCRTDDQNTTIAANFQGKNPNQELVEINVRDSCFYPDQTGRNYITVRGFHMSEAATRWAAPTAEQIGLIGTNWSKGWIIENNVVSNSKCAGITLGKDRASGDNAWRGSHKSGNDVYNEVIVKALRNGWSKARIGSHIVRNNTIFACEQAGICGSMGAAFSQITGNHVYDIYTKRLFTGQEMAGIKIHGAIDTLIQGNCVHNTARGIWMDWMAQGTRIRGNLLYDNSSQDLYMEVDHGPYLIDNNLLLSSISLWDMSDGGAYAHNLFAGRIVWRPDVLRKTPFFLPHSTTLAGLRLDENADDRFYNNIFAHSPVTVGDVPQAAMGQTGAGLSAYNAASNMVQTGGNLYLNGATPLYGEKDAAIDSSFNPQLQLQAEGGVVKMRAHLANALPLPACTPVTTALLGTTRIVGAHYENPNGLPLQIDTDYFGKKRNMKHLQPGPFNRLPTGDVTWDLWPTGRR